MSLKTPFLLLLTGEPGVGKTTLVKSLSASLKSSFGVEDVRGFYTEEIRDGTHGRIGFDVVDINNQTSRASLARLTGGTNQSWPKVGKYSVDVRSFESMALPLITGNVKPKQVIIIDEIGKMESFSHGFERAVGELASKIQTNDLLLIATVPTRSLALADKLKSHPLARVFTVTRQNRNQLNDEIIKCLMVE